MPPVGLISQQYTFVHFSEEDRAQRCALCLRPDCSSCVSSPDSYLAHKECLDIRTNLPLSGKATCEEIWDIGVATKPWSISPMEETVFKPSKEELEILFPRLENSDTKNLVQKLLDLPDELFRMIMWQKADRSTLARITLVSQFKMDLIHKLKYKWPLPELDFTNPELRKLGFAFLGVYYQPFIKSLNPPADQSVIRLGVDYLGVRTAEILERYPATGRQQARNSTWYIIERFCRARAQFKIGPFLRIVSLGHEKVQMWNVMNPPQHGSYHSAGRHSISPRRTRCIDMRAVTGLTVFCDNRSIYGIYAHRADEMAVDAYRSLHPTCQHTVMWRYFPFQPKEVITRAWIRENSGFASGTILVIYTSRDRRCFFGACDEGDQTSYQVLCDAPLEHLLYDDPALGGAISWFGAAPKPSSLQTDPKDDGNDPEFHHTHASLMHVVQAEIYYDDYGASTGILFRYLDGSFESIGQRRVGLSTTKVTQVDLPLRIHFRAFEIETHDHRMLLCRRQCVEVQLSSGDSELLFREWQSQDMAGTVTWSFTLRKDIVYLS
ncbi:hypothetical protein G7Y89_g13537 [Cudoniella acicularis]|uniref:Uncharacterized protein n=1 Tax=Cudoniella acicularis TaxID=354080 RepID=A0A8H4R787_9HELO|nr:hypothetical protein G7Y89_g13537 [Cudoniella acicularis]